MSSTSSETPPPEPTEPALSTPHINSSSTAKNDAGSHEKKTTTTILDDANEIQRDLENLSAMLGRNSKEINDKVELALKKLNEMKRESSY
ncbi:hypothetical protein KGF56_000248 [Candida oxycetoniae]|uniref:Uncharacterized protein n=1 Tax=Candida oxycetoniae TaxID=497107 RepID=A0AAI9X0F1_9ASCO|nr:uncharacterized protein KGF56_000248 [Candida oxycetoniae]KAI3406955.2 hypothetical protein KGF56_000248 [Candida oxycetoniae]